MKKIYVLIFTVWSVLSLFSVDIKDLEENIFIGLNIDTSIVRVKGIYKNTQSFTVAYSSILPAYGVYWIQDKKTKNEALIQIGEAKVYEEPFNLYLSDTLYKYFISKHDKKSDSINLVIKYIGSLKEGALNNTPEIFNMVVDSDKSVNRIIKNGLNTNYIQIGSFREKHNAYPIIAKLMHYFKAKPHFYIMKVIVKDKKQEKIFYRVLVGPYEFESAKKIAKTINDSKKAAVFIKSSETIVDEYTGTKNH